MQISVWTSEAREYYVYLIHPLAISFNIFFYHVLHINIKIMKELQTKPESDYLSR